jgi:hypothetical protein
MASKDLNGVATEMWVANSQTENSNKRKTKVK